MNFEKCLEYIFKWEGEYVDDPRDPGGETKYGISKKAFPKLDIKNLTKKHAALIYKEQYYYPIFGDQLPQEIRLLVFSSAVNQGVSFAIKTLQKIVKAKVDGKMGPETLKKITDFDVNKLKEEFLKRQVEQYFSLNKPEFLRGWIIRLVEASCAF